MVVGQLAAAQLEYIRPLHMAHQVTLQQRGQMNPIREAHIRARHIPQLRIAKALLMAVAANTGRSRLKQATVRPGSGEAQRLCRFAFGFNTVQAVKPGIHPKPSMPSATMPYWNGRHSDVYRLADA
jgi:hypothetical protein